MKDLPFEIGKSDTFFDKLNEWIGDVFYDTLPEAGFEERDEQIFMAFQLERAFKEKNVVFAEAGVGTGKTIVYLLYAICYARYIGKPAIIACADETLIEQLVKAEGDIAKLAKVLNLDIDVRLAKSPDNYLCLNKLEEEIAGMPSEEIEAVYDQLPEFVYDHGTLVKFHHYGDRKEYANLNDEAWAKIGWDYFQDCFMCDKRHRCGQTLSREHYRRATDLIICSQDFYMEHVWTYEARQREGQLPLLPEASCVVFDEGHLVEYAAQKALTYRLKESTLENMLTNFMQNDVRESLAYTVENTIEQNQQLFDTIYEYAKPVEGSNRMEFKDKTALVREAKKLRDLVIEIGEGLVFESEMYTLNEYDLKVIDEHLDMIDHALNLFTSNTNVVTWAEDEDGVYTLVIMPRAVEEILQERVFSKKIPYVFSSATLSKNRDFSYMENSLGIKNALSFSVESPFDYDEVMTIYKHTLNKEELREKAEMAFELVKENGGKSLLLFRTKEELRFFKNFINKQETEFAFLFEGDQEISTLVAQFQNDVDSTLCAVHMWEGLDVPGMSLSQVIIWSLPFPPNDPVFQAKRNYSKDPFNDVDLPYMILRLRQGIGRLIRTSEDSGNIHLFIDEHTSEVVMKEVEAALPVEMKQG
ncbi:MAG: ATP-dependent DNA helicase [Bacillaceae bacterium]